MSSRHLSPAPDSEQTPLLSRTDSYTGHAANDDANEEPPSPKPKKSWPVILAISSLSIALILALVFGFATPAAVETYVKEALSFEADNISIESFTDTGVRARIRGTVWLEAEKVHRKSVRDLGRFATYIAKEVESGEAHIQVYLPKYNDALLGSAWMPSVKLNIRNGHYNYIDKIIDLEPGDADGIQRMAHDFMDHQLNELTVRAVATVPVKSGLISMNQKVTQFMTFSGTKIPKAPKPDLDSLKVVQHHNPEGIKAQAQLSIPSNYPISLDIPPMSFDVLLPDCSEGYLLFATTSTQKIEIRPKHNITVGATGFMTKLPTSLTTTCPGSDRSPLDEFIANYLRGKDASVFIRGGKQSSETPAWIGRLLRDTVLPVPLPAKPFDNTIKNFSLANVHFSLPEDVKGRPSLSATARVLVGLPKDMDFDINVNRVRSLGSVYYEGEEMGKLDLSKWQESRSKKVNGDLLVESDVVDAPLDITNENVFARIIQKMIFKHEGVSLDIDATVDVDATTALGTFVVSGIPSKGKIFIDPPKTGGFEHKVGEISVVDSTENTLTMQAKVTITNPTEYYASMPRVDAELFVNGTKMGNAWGSGNIKPGENEITTYIEWMKTDIGAQFLSQFISGYNVSLTVSPGKLPGMPKIPMNITVPVPHTFGKFLKDTTIHLLSATATFVLFSPISMWVTEIHSTAFYNGSEIGTIDWEYPFAVEVGDNETPRLPVDWNTPGSGLIRDALGGALKIDAYAQMGVRIGNWRQDIWYSAKGLGAHVRL